MNPNCIRCGTQCLLARDKAANGATQVFYWCVHCARYANIGDPFLKKEYVTRVLQEDIDSLPRVARFGGATNPRCEYRGCQSTETEYHHWAPRHLFGTDCENWPGGYLCDTHHHLWHNVVTPKMNQRANGHAPAVPEPVE